MLRGFCLAVSLSLALSLGLGCTGNLKSSQQGRQCSQGLKAAYEELRAARADGLGETVELTKAAGLLTAAKVQYEFEHYPNCIDKVRRARLYIKSAREG